MSKYRYLREHLRELLTEEAKANACPDRATSLTESIMSKVHQIRNERTHLPRDNRDTET